MYQAQATVIDWQALYKVGSADVTLSSTIMRVGLTGNTFLLFLGWLLYKDLIIEHFWGVFFGTYIFEIVSLKGKNFLYLVTNQNFSFL